MIDKIKTFDGQTVNLKILSLSELYLLHYNEELKYVKAIKETKPFSKKRRKLLKDGYETIIKIAKYRNNDITAMGADKRYIKLINYCISDMKKYKPTNMPIIFYEIGVGFGLIFQIIEKIDNVIVNGCDVNKIYDSSKVLEMDVVEALNKLENNSVDIFYWNDVLEHILDDEIEIVMSLIRQKLRIGGIVITITPNRLTGPHDISRLYEPLGTKSKGFHFQEYSFAEVLTLMKNYKLKSCNTVIKLLRNIIVLPWNIDVIKIILEKLTLSLPYKIKRIVLSCICSDISIVKKKL